MICDNCCSYIIRDIHARNTGKQNCLAFVCTNLDKNHFSKCKKDELLDVINNNTMPKNVNAESNQRIEMVAKHLEFLRNWVNELNKEIEQNKFQIKSNHEETGDNIDKIWKELNDLKHQIILVEKNNENKILNLYLNILTNTRNEINMHSKIKKALHKSCEDGILDVNEVCEGLEEMYKKSSENMKDHFKNSNNENNNETNKVFFNCAVSNVYRFKKMSFVTCLDEFRKSLKQREDIHDALYDLTELLYSLLELFEAKTNNEMRRNADDNA